ncbi:unnamed protein product [Staurois parvus]|uniref:Deoxyuridine 5'-triphosphate nucleotidohydrolase n=1 Tax=Staurois parvus TaxID=386267 RepID=A0ABN9DPZ3_9NEOB|nr:unnamed protein product [Staurois parvus]
MHEKAKTPLRASPEAAGLDLYSIETMVIPPGKVRIISTGIGCQIPLGHYGQLATISSMAVRGAVVLGGVIDADYQGEIKVVIINLSTEAMILTAQDQVAQLLLISLYIANIKEGEAPTTLTVRGDQGFGSTNTVNVGAKIWVQGAFGPPEPAEVIAVGKDPTLLIMKPGREKWEYVPQEKCYLRE